MNIEDYRAVKICDCCDENVDYGVIMLNNKHTIKEFQEVVYKIKNRYTYNGNYDWQVDDILSESDLDIFDWFTIPSDCDDYIEI